MEKLAAADSLQDISTLITRRQQHVLRLIVEGKQTKEITATLGLSVKTVETHRAGIMRRTECSNIADLIKLAYRYGLAAAQ